MNKIVLKGSAAHVKWGYQPAAELGAWTLDGTSFSARLVSHDVFRLSQQPLTLVVRRAHGKPWVWQIDELSLIDGMVTANVRSQEP